MTKPGCFTRLPHQAGSSSKASSTTTTGGDGDGAMLSTAALRIPILPHTSPEATSPPGLKIPLYPHQLRALHRCQVIESQVKEEGDITNYGASTLASGFNSWYHYQARGGVLADEVGTGKTATSIALVLSDDMINDNNDDANTTKGGVAARDTLVVAPKHLIPQWKQEIEKFADPNALQVVVGRHEYEQTYAMSNKRRIVLVDVDTIIQADKLWYNWKQFYTEDGTCVTRNLSDATFKLYRQAALFSVKSAKGPCSYEGWTYIDSLHLPQRPWRRVIYDEIQDLVREGSESQKNLLQLTRTAQNVWLLSATPFPHGNASVYANHQLLGFNRLKMDVTSGNCELPEDHPFEQIKRKLYIRSPRHVADTAKSGVTLIRNTKYVAQLDLESRFYQLEKQKISSAEPEQAAANTNNCSGESEESNPFGTRMDILRQMTVHPEASEELRKVMNEGRIESRQVSVSVHAAAKRSIRDAQNRLEELNQYHYSETTLLKHLREINHSIEIAKKVQEFRQNTPLRVSVFNAGATSDAALIAERQRKECQIIHNQLSCTCTSPGSGTCRADRSVYFRKIVGQNDLAYGQRPTLNQEFIIGSFENLIQYFQEDLAEDKRLGLGGGEVPALEHYLHFTKQTKKQRERVFVQIQEERQQLRLRIETLSAALETKGGRSTTHNLSEEERLAQRHGSKPAALVQFLKSLNLDKEQVIVFSYWHDTLKLVQRTLSRCKLKCVFLDRRNPQALTAFISGQVPILLLSAQAQASGANLQCASHVVLLDPAGSSAEHGSTLEEQAIGRAARMGQDKPVTVTRFCVVGTLEEDLFEAIDQAAQAKALKAKDTKYVIAKSTMEAPITSVKTETPKPDADDVKVTAEVSQAERLAKSFQSAQEAGDVIDLLEDDASDDEGKDRELERSQASSPPTQLKPVKVKTEYPEAKASKGKAVDSAKSEEDVENPKVLPDKTKETAAPQPGKRSFDDTIDSSQQLGPSKQARTTNTDDPATFNLTAAEKQQHEEARAFALSGTSSDFQTWKAEKQHEGVLVSESETNLDDRAPSSNEDESGSDTSITPSNPDESTTPSSGVLKREVSVESHDGATVSPEITSTLSDYEQSMLKGLLQRMSLSEYETRLLKFGRSVSWLVHHVKDAVIMEEVADAVGFTASHAIRFHMELLKESDDLLHMERAFFGCNKQN